MSDPRFFTCAAPATLAELARIANATISGDADPSRMIDDVAPLRDAGPAHISFLDNRKYIEAFRATKAGAVLLLPEFAEQCPPGTVALVTRKPYMSWAHVVRRFYPSRTSTGIRHPSAIVDPAATIGSDVEIGAGAVIEARAEIGNRCRIGPNAVIGVGVVLGDDTEVGANATINYALIGQRCRIYPGACIGQEGFGFAMDAAGHVPIPQLGRVIIEDDVEVGANTCVDRGAGPDTVIGRGTMIDNLVQIGHNVTIGRGCVIAAQVGISGSSRIGDFVAFGGQVGIAGHLSIGAGAQLMGQSGVISDIPAGVTVAGFPATPSKEFYRQTAMLRRLVRERKERS
ncbi:UDP-3-O-(3-hydroxymyristoyl)glucosamine N-acyltransferase [Roseiterribacter gracilis]|uniref:UDP-3-O-acylglucosamine N-acyltransferase n=1 Tax=Roseiterribacter gracilis TaxID=2812848 RepID=A0A8S8XBA3_9PROT|nr:UDP-3-O-acylglucosamine N-acyltransferase [Rhodospirillales bacterium TMPK1]